MRLQPILQRLVFLALPLASACGSGATSSPDTLTYAVGGTVTGLHGMVTLTNNGGDPLSLSADGAFAFETRLVDGAPYAVAVATQPDGQSCGVSAGVGIIAGGDVGDVIVSCSDLVVDGDGDGDPSTTDCNDADPSIHHGAAEACDDVDSDCDGSLADEFPDHDGDGEPDCIDADDDDDSILDFADACPTGATAWVPSQVTDFDGDGCEDASEDADDDGDGDEDSSDCAPLDAAISHDADELPGSGRDEDCDGISVCYADADGDGFRHATNTIDSTADEACDASAGEALATAELDCDDGDDAQNPGASEIVGSGKDEDCDGISVCFVDGDQDGYRHATNTVSSTADEACSGNGEALASAGLDCDDDDDAQHPGASEVIGSGKDENCDGTSVCYADADKDGFRHATTTVDSTADEACDGSAGEALATAELDCDDGDAAQNPAASEVVGSGKDEDCDGTSVCYADADKDGFRHATKTANSTTDEACSSSDGEALADAGVDCDEADAGQNPGATEIVGSGKDEDCDGTSVCYADADRDGFRHATNTVSSTADEACDGNGEALASAGIDCDDGDAAQNPAASEVIGSGKDEDCDGTSVCHADADKDGFRHATKTANSTADEACSASDGEALASATVDCDDTNIAIYPDAPESCDAIDSDCDGSIVDGFADTDSDLLPDCIDEDDDDDTHADTVDCAPLDASIHPGATELDDCIDQDCDGDAAESELFDSDGDGFSAGCGDCAPSDATRYPGAVELADDDLDSNCDGKDPKASAGVGLYVDAASSCTTSCGSKAAPYAKLSDALLAANAATGPTDVFVAVGAYTASGTSVTKSTNLYGGYASGFASRKPAASGAADPTDQTNVSKITLWSGDAALMLGPATSPIGCVVENVAVFGWGTGTSRGLRVSNNVTATLVDNYVASGPADYAHAVVIYSGATATLENNTIRGEPNANAAQNSYGISNELGGTAYVYANDISGNAVAGTITGTRMGIRNTGTMIISGASIIGGYGANAYGVLNQGALLVEEGTTISAGEVYGGTGNGISVSGVMSTLTVRDSMIDGGSAAAGASSSGHYGIYSTSASVIAYRNLISATALPSGSGLSNTMAVYGTGTASSTADAMLLVGNIIYGGRTTGIGATGVDVSTMPLTLAGNTIVAGVAASQTQGVSVSDGTALVANNIIERHSEDSAGSHFGVSVFQFGAETTVHLLDNDVYTPTGTMLRWDWSASSDSASVVNGCSWTGCGSLTGGNIDAAPGLDGSLQLTAGSACIDAGYDLSSIDYATLGVPDATAYARFDYGGGQRPVDGDASGSDEWDIGADEYGSP